MRTPTGVERDRSSRRALLAHSLGALAAVTAPHHARAIVNGAAVTDAEAASTGTVGLYIDLEGCQVCRKGVPATCTGTLVAPDLVLSAKHCIDVPRDLNGTLTRVVFASDMLKAGAPSVDVERYVTTSDYGIETAGNDLVLIKLKRPAPAGWRVAELPLGLLPEKAEFEEARRAGSPFFPDGLGFPTVTTYGYGQQSSEGTVDIAKYKAGELKRIDVDVRSEVRPYAPAFLTTPVNKKAGTCAGDSGGPALVVVLADPLGRGARQLLLGVQAAASTPCEGNQAIFVYPDAFRTFLLKASKELGSPLRPTISWRDYSST